MIYDLNSYSKRAAFAVTAASALFVLVLLIQITVMGYIQSKPMNTEFVAPLITSCPQERHYCQLALELMVQEARNSRAGLALYYRFAISATAVVVSLATIVLGSVLVFDRVAKHNDQVPPARDEADTDTAPATGGQGNSLAGAVGKNHMTVDSAYPGVILCAMGAICLMGTLILSGPKAAPITLVDIPIYLERPTSPAHASMTVGVPPSDMSVLDIIRSLNYDQR